MLKFLDKYKKIEETLTVFLLVIIPLYPKFPLFSVPGTYVAIRIEDILVATVFCYLFCKYFNKRNSVIKISLTKAFVVYIVLSTVSLIYSTMITNTTQPLLGSLHLLRRVQYITPFFLGYFAVKNKSINKTFILKTFALVIFMVLIYGLGQKYLQWPIIVTQNREYAKGIALRSIPGGHLNSTFAGHYDLASYLILVIPIFIVYFAKIFKLNQVSKKSFVALLIILFGTWLVGISGSRISTVSFTSAGIMTLIISRKPKVIPFFVITAIIIFSFSSSLMARYQRLIEVGKERIELLQEQMISQVQNGILVYAQNDADQFPEKRMYSEPTPTPIPVLEDRSTSIRLNIEWPRAVRAFYKNPLLGTGLSSITLATDNDYLRLIGELGIFGFMAFTSIFFVIGRKLILAIKNISEFDELESSIIIGFTGALFGIFLNAIFIDIFEASKFAITYWLLLGIVMGIIENKLVIAKD